jgi:hypothetical protein
VPQTVEAGLREDVAPRRLETRLGKSRDVFGGALRPHESARRSTGERSMARRPAAEPRQSRCPLLAGTAADHCPDEGARIIATTAVFHSPWLFL